MNQHKNAEKGLANAGLFLITLTPPINYLQTHSEYVKVLLKCLSKYLIVFS